jgi:hypothetical protein
MSSVNTVTIQADNITKETLGKLNGWLKENNHLGNEFQLISGDTSAGTKYPDKHLVWGGLNYLNYTEFIPFFKSLDLTGALMTIFNQDGDWVSIVKSDDVMIEEV